METPHLSPFTSGSVDALVAELTRHLAEQRVADAADSRSREHWLRQADAESQTLAGVLIDLVERGDRVVVSVPGGRLLRGHVRAVAQDFAVMDTAAGPALVQFASVLAVRAEGRSIQGADRPPSLAMDWPVAVAVLAEDRPRVLVVATDGTSQAGELRSAGVDVVTLRVAAPGADLFVPVGTIAALIVTEP